MVVGVAVLGMGVEEMFEHLPSLLGRQLEHCFLAFTQAQPLHEQVRLHLQHSTIFHHVIPRDWVMQHYIFPHASTLALFIPFTVLEHRN